MEQGHQHIQVYLKTESAQVSCSEAILRHGKATAPVPSRGLARQSVQKKFLHSMIMGVLLLLSPHPASTYKSSQLFQRVWEPHSVLKVGQGTKFYKALYLPYKPFFSLAAITNPCDKNNASIAYWLCYWLTPSLTGEGEDWFTWQGEAPCKTQHPPTPEMLLWESYSMPLL